MFLSSDTSGINRQTIEVSSLQYHDVLERCTARAWKQSHRTCPIRTFNVLGGDEKVVLNRDIRISDYHLCEQTLEYVRGAAPLNTSRCASAQALRKPKVMPSGTTERNALGGFLAIMCSPVILPR